MANPRMTHEFDELFVKRLTAGIDSSLTYKRGERHGTDMRHAPVKFTGNRVIGLCEDGDAPIGSLERIDPDGSAVVAWLGSVSYKGTATPGVAVVGNGTGGVRAAVAGTETGTGVAGSSDNGVVVVFQ